MLDAFEVGGPEYREGYDDDIRDEYYDSVEGDPWRGLWEDSLEGDLFDPETLIPLILLLTAVFGRRKAEEIKGAIMGARKSRKGWPGPRRPTLTRNQYFAALKKARLQIALLKRRRALMLELLRKQRLLRQPPGWRRAPMSRAVRRPIRSALSQVRRPISSALSQVRRPPGVSPRSVTSFLRSAARRVPV